VPGMENVPPDDTDEELTTTRTRYTAHIATTEGRFVSRADEKLMALLTLESAVRGSVISGVKYLLYR
jgi:hypothetical protein